MRARIQTGLFVATTAALLLNSPAVAAEKVALQYSFKKGETHAQKMVMKQKIEQEMSGQKMSITQNIGFGLVYTVKDVDAKGVATVGVTYKWVKFDQAGPMGNSEYDSADPPETTPPQAAGLAGLLGQGYEAKIASSGKVLEIVGADKMLANMTKSLPDGPMKEMMAKQLENQFGGNALKDMMSSSMDIFVGKPVGVGDSWSRTMDVKAGMAMKLENTWTVKSIRSDGVELAVKSKLVSDASKPMEMGAMKVNYDMKGDQEGTITVDPKTGWTTQARLHQTMHGEMKMDNPAGGGMSVPMSIDSTTTIGLLDLKKLESGNKPARKPKKATEEKSSEE